MAESPCRAPLSGPRNIGGAHASVTGRQFGQLLEFETAAPSSASTRPICSAESAQRNISTAGGIPNRRGRSGQGVDHRFIARLGNAAKRSRRHVAA